MAYAPSISFPRDLPAQSVRTPQRSIWRRIFDAAIQARMRQAEREIALYLAQHGGLTDDAEREIENRILNRQRW